MLARRSTFDMLLLMRTLYTMCQEHSDRELHMQCYYSIDDVGPLGNISLQLNNQSHQKPSIYYVQADECVTFLCSTVNKLQIDN